MAVAAPAASDASETLADSGVDPLDSVTVFGQNGGRWTIGRTTLDGDGHTWHDIEVGQTIVPTTSSVAVATDSAA